MAATGGSVGIAAKDVEHLATDDRLVTGTVATVTLNGCSIESEQACRVLLHRWRDARYTQRSSTPGMGGLHCGCHQLPAWVVRKPES